MTSKNANGTWTLQNVAAPSAVRSTYVTQFPVYLDGNGLVSQSGAFANLCTPKVDRNCKTQFTREIIITRPADYSSIGIEAVVTWAEPGKTTPYEIRIPYALTNWKYEFYRDDAVATSTVINGGWSNW